MACDCEHISIKTYGRLDLTQNPAVVVGRAHVMVESVCQEVEKDEHTEPMLAAFGGHDRQKIAHDAELAGEKLCFNYITVSLLQATVGWKITEVQVGSDTFLANIAANASERFALGPCESCELEKASVKIVDAAGAVQTILGGFKACHCQAA